jgi:hypothetical protein
MRHRQKILNDYPADTDLRVLAVSFRCSPSEYAVLARAADACAMPLGAYVRDEVVSHHMAMEGRPREVRLRKKVLDALTRLTVRLHRVHQSLRLDTQQRRPLSEDCAAEIVDITRLCRSALGLVMSAMSAEGSNDREDPGPVVVEPEGILPAATDPDPPHRCPVPLAD